MITLRSLRLSLLSLCSLLLAGFVSGAAADTLSIGGAALKPGTYPWHEGARLHDAAVAGQVRADAWFLGAALLRFSAIEPQQRLKDQLLADLRANRLHARAQNKTTLLHLLERLDALVTVMPVTGRVPAQLDPFQLLLKKNNALLRPGDQLLYPTRPAQIRVVGAVAADCVLTFDAALALKDYLRQCPPHAAVDRNVVQIIQPDGRIQEVGIAHWNQQQVSLAVGAVIYRPLKRRLLVPETADLNRDMAALLATQYQLGGHFSE